jgi:hypothetical protein
MRQVEKLDLILRALYSRRASSQDEYLQDICKQERIPLVSRDELYKLTKRLENDNLIECNYIQAGIYAELTSHGIEYCEEDSYSLKGQSIINNNYNLTITNSPNANIVSASTSVYIQNNNYSDLKSKFQEFRKKITNDSIIDESQKAEIIECLTEVEDAVEAGRKPKFSFKQLSEQASNVAGVSSLLLQIAQMIFGSQ